MGQHRKMVNMKIEETSGVDHPAHEHEGWIVMKSATAESVESLFGALGKPEEAPVATINKDAELTPEQKLEAAEARVAELEAAAAAPVVEPVVEPVAEPVVEPVVEAEAAEDGGLEKALAKMPEPIRAFLAKQKADLAEAQATINKERDQRLDSEAITKSKDLFKAIAIDHSAVAPALRRVALLDSDLAKAVETALSAADAQLASGTSLTKEVGKGGGNEGGSAIERINKAAEALREEDTKLSASQAFAKALEVNPELYAAYSAEKAGK